MNYQEILRRLALGDTSFLPDAPPKWTCAATGGLDARSRAFARLGAAVAVGASSAGYQDHVDAALAAGATRGDVVDVLIAVIPTVGLPKVVSAAPPLGLAVGYDVDGALEGFEGE